MAMHGDIVIDPIVAQGCRPIGRSMRITRSHQNLLLELDERPTLEVLRELYDSLNERDQGLARHSLFLGVVMSEFQENPQLGDFLIRNIVGMEPKAGALAIGEILHEGQIVQFHLRDAQTSAEDLTAMLTRYTQSQKTPKVVGALLFSCLGRGMYLYGRPDHDTDLFRSTVGNIPLGGFFCNGEIGPVGGTTYLHGYTSSFGIFRPKD
jgi:small ligand-binding sensory domain FIST